MTSGREIFLRFFYYEWVDTDHFIYVEWPKAMRHYHKTSMDKSNFIKKNRVGLKSDNVNNKMKYMK